MTHTSTEQERARVLFNPYTGTPRHPLDIESDPQGLLIVAPGAELQAARCAPVVPEFSPVAQKKLAYLLEAGEAITGYAIENKDGRRGAIDCHGFVYWWQDAAAHQPPEATKPNLNCKSVQKRIAAQAEVDMVSCSCGDMYPPMTFGAAWIYATGKCENCCAAEDAEPVQLPEPVAWRYMPSEVWKQLEITQDKEREKLARSFGLEVEPLYTEHQVRQLLAAPQPACNQSMQPTQELRDKAEHEALREVYENARGVLRYDGIDAARLQSYMQGLSNAVEDVKLIDSGLWEPEVAQEGGK